MSSWQLRRTLARVMGDKTDIGVSTRLSKIHSLRGRYFLCASVHNCRGNGRDIGTLTQVLWWGYSQRTRNESLIVVGEGGRRGANYCHFTNNRLCFRLGLGQREPFRKSGVF